MLLEIAECAWALLPIHWIDQFHFLWNNYTFYNNEFQSPRYQASQPRLKELDNSFGVHVTQGNYYRWVSFSGVKPFHPQPHTLIQRRRKCQLLDHSVTKCPNEVDCANYSGKHDSNGCQRVSRCIYRLPLNKYHNTVFDLRQNLSHILPTTYREILKLILNLISSSSKLGVQLSPIWAVGCSADRSIYFPARSFCPSLMQRLIMTLYLWCS